MSKFQLPLLFLMISLLSYGQNIDVNSQGLFLNSTEITKQSNPSDIKKNLGKPDKITVLANTIWTYHDLGMTIYFGLKTKTVNSVQFDYILENGTFSSEKIFQGEFKVNGVNITATTSLSAFQNIPNLNFEKERYPTSVYSASRRNTRLTIQYVNGNSDLQGVGLSFK